MDSYNENDKQQPQEEPADMAENMRNAGSGDTAGSTTPEEPAASSGPYQVPPIDSYTHTSSSYIPDIPGNPEPPVRRNGGGWKVGVAVLCIICLCGSIFGGVYWSSLLKNDSTDDHIFSFPSKEKKDAETETQEVTELQNTSYDSVADIAEDVGKSVVTIVTTIESNDSMGIIGSSYSGEALGSGVIIGEDGDELYIATNYHVISGATAVSVLIGEDETAAIDAHYKGSDSQMDLAVIYVNKSEISEDILSDIKIATLGESDDMELGDLAIAIGSPLDKSYSNTVTAGIISGLERSVTFKDDDGTSKTLVLLQTDAAINPGNSGGALVNGRGEVIGINNAKIVADDIEGMGFALPMSTAKPILEELINHGKVVRPYLGITGTAIQSGSEFATYYNLLSGIYVASVVEGGAADQAGIKKDDVIISFDGKVLNTFQDLTDALNACEIGQEVTLEIIRGYAEGDSQTLTVKAVIQEKPGDIE